MDFGVELVCGLFYFITRDKEISKSKIVKYYKLGNQLLLQGFILHIFWDVRSS